MCRDPFVATDYEETAKDSQQHICVAKLPDCWKELIKMTFLKKKNVSGVSHPYHS